VDADGALVTPGFVDVHCHYDGQATWDSQIVPSAWHGVTTAVMGNCGVGFAPVREVDHQRLIELMEGVEDIPGSALHEGLEWDWESFPEYLDALEPRDAGSGVTNGEPPCAGVTSTSCECRRERGTSRNVAASASSSKPMRFSPDPSFWWLPRRRVPAPPHSVQGSWLRGRELAYWSNKSGRWTWVAWVTPSHMPARRRCGASTTA
jgi:hypothetical protein